MGSHERVKGSKEVEKGEVEEREGGKGRKWEREGTGEGAQYNSQVYANGAPLDTPRSTYVTGVGEKGDKEDRGTL